MPIIDARGDIKSQTKDKTLLIQPNFSVASSKGDNGEAPLQVFSKFSRWVITVIDTTAQQKAVSHNLSIHRGGKFEADEFISALKYGIQSEYPYTFGEKQASAQSAQTPQSGTCYTQKLTMNPFKGITPAQALQQDPANREQLLKQYSILKENAEKYAINKKCMAAIQEAVTLYDKGELQSAPEAAADPSGFVLYQSAPKPNIYKKDSEGMCPVSEMKVTISHGNNYPFEIEVLNYRCPVTERTGGSINAQKGQAKDRVSHTFRISLGDMAGFVAEMERAQNAFYTLHYMGCEKEAEELEKAQRDAAKANGTYRQQSAPAQQAAQPQQDYYPEPPMEYYEASMAAADDEKLPFS